jgi:hypothetical protein
LGLWLLVASRGDAIGRYVWLSVLLMRGFFAERSPKAWSWPGSGVAIRLPWTSELLDGVDTAGPVVPLSVALVVGVSCLLATLAPALGATRVDPAVSLKAE